MPDLTPVFSQIDLIKIMPVSVFATIEVSIRTEKAAK